MAHAADCPNFNVPDSHTTPSTSPMASGGTIQIDASSCDPTGGIAGIGAIVTQPSHGTASVNAVSEVVTYTNNGDGSTTDTFSFDDANGNPITVNVSIAAATASFTVTPTSLPTPQVGSAYGPVTMSASGGTGPYTFTETSGSLPPGMTFSSGTFSGTPTEAGNYTVDIQVKDSTGATTTKSYAVDVPAPTFSFSSLPQPIVGVAYNQSIVVTGGTSPYGSFTVTSGSLPPGMSLSSAGVLSGIPTTANAYTFTVQMADSSTPTTYYGTHSYTLTVANATVPGAPTIGTATAGNAQASVSFTAPASDGGASITGYTATSSPGGLTGTCAASPCTVAGLANGTAYTFTVTATNSVGTGPASATSNSVTPSTVPGAPTSVTATAQDGQATVTFAAPSSDGGLAITGYTVTSSPAGGVDSNAGSTSLSHVITGLTNGTAYTFTVTATNTDGAGPASSPSASVTPKAAQTITFANPNSQNFGTSPTLTATATSGLAVTFSSTTTAVCTVTSGGTLTFASAGTCTIDADQAGNSAYAAAPTVTQSFSVNAVVPGAPVIGTPIAGDAQVSVAFAAPASDGGATITAYTATSSPGGLTGSCASSPCTVSGLTNGTAYTFTVTATNSAGTGSPSAASASVTPKAAQTITFNNPGSQNFGTSPTLTATATSGLAVTFSSTTTAVCTVTSGGALTFASAGMCTIDADQAGNSAYAAAPTVTQSFSVNAVVPGAPVIGTPTAGDTLVSIAFAAPASDGGAAITAYMATSNPGGLTGICASSPCVVTGLTNGVAYTFTVSAANSAGFGATSAASSAVTPAATQTITFNNPGSQNFGTSPTLTATATSGLAVTFTSATPSVCTVTSGGTLSTVAVGSCTIDANQGGNGAYTAAAQVSQTFSIVGVVPGAPTIGSATAGPAQATVTFTAPAFTGGEAITAYTATSNPGGLTGTCAASPCTVTGLTNGTAYTFTVTAANAAGTGPASAPSNSVTPKAVGTITHFTANPASPVYKPGGTFTVSATGDGSSSPLVFAIDPSSASVCSISGSTVTTLSAGNCIITANQAGDATHAAAAQVTLTVAISNPPPPTVNNVAANTTYNTAATIDLSGAISGIDVTGVHIATQPAHGTVSVSGETATYTPSSTFYGGTDSFTYTATNPGGTSAPATVTVTVGKPAVPTVAAKSVTTPYNTATSIDLSGSITGVDVTSIAVASGPSHGTVSVSGETVTYTPSSSYYGGTDSFTYTATNPGGSSAPATVTITVKALDVPTAQALTVSTSAGASVQIQATAGASGPQPFTGVSVAQAPAHGQATASGEQIVYTPAAGFIGTDHFTYRIANHFGASAPAGITVTVTAAGRTSAPDGTTTVTSKPGTPVSVDLASILPGSYTSSTLLGLSPAGAGQVSIGQPTALTFTSTATFHGLVQITALLTAADGHTATVGVLVLVNNQPDPSQNADVRGLINAQAQAAQRFAQSQLDNIQQRLDSLHDGDDQRFSNTLSLSLDGKSLRSRRMAGDRRGLMPGEDPRLQGGIATTTQPPGIGEANDGMMMSPDTATPGAAPAAGGHAPPGRGPTGLAAWIDGTAAFGRFDSYRQAAGFNANDIAVNMGVDQRIGAHGLFGFSLGYDHDRSTVGNDGTRSTAQGYSAAMYGSFAPSARTYIDAVLGGGGLRFDSRRNSGDGSYLFGHRNGNQWFGSLTAGYEYHRARWVLSPYGRLQWSYSALNGFAETGDVADALAYGRQSVRTSLAVLGVRASGLIMTQSAVLVPRARLEVGHDFQGTSNTTLSYAFVPTAGSWNVLTNPYSANGNSVQAGLGLDIQLPRSLTLTTDYSVLVQPHSRDQMIRLGLQKKF